MDRCCNNCALFITTKSMCARTNLIEEMGNHCSHWCEELPTCAICGRRFVAPINWMMCGEEARPLCASCVEASGTCQGCQYGGYCDFRESSIPLPKFVQTTIRKGNAVISTQIPNPERIAKTCKVNCKCFSETGCLRQWNTCENYKFILDENE